MGALFPALFLAVSGTVEARTINARSVSFNDVREAVTSAANGDTVIVPAGTASWTKSLVIKKPITLIGQTTVSYNNETAADRTIIYDDVPRWVNPPAPIIHAVVTSGDMAVEPTVPLFQIKGFTFRGSVNTLADAPHGAIMLAGTCPAVRISNCHFDRLHQISVYTFGWIYGVMDNCLHTMSYRDFTGVMGMPTYNGQQYGDGSWMEDAHWGSYKFFFTENNVVHNLSSKDGANMDAKRGARYVVRYSKLYDCSFIQTHGTEGDPDRGCRAIEFYNNICHRSASGPGYPGSVRSGNILFHDNKYTGLALNNPWVAAWAARIGTAFQPWGLASGNNPWDQNDPHGLYASGKALTDSIVSADKSSTSFYVAGNLSAYNTGGYSIQNSRTALGGLIWSAVYNKTTNKTLITCDYSVAWNTSKVDFNIGDPFQICRVLRVLDQMGLGRGTLCSTPKTLSGAVNEASYAWNNTQANGTNVIIHSGAPANPTFVGGRDYFNSAPPFGYRPYTYPHPLVTP